MLGTSEIMAVPDPLENYIADEDDWLDAYNTELGSACGVRLEPHEPHTCPPRGRGLWIAGIELEDELFSHAVVCRESFVWHDPAGIVQGQLDLRTLVKGFTLTRKQLLVPNFSPARVRTPVVAG